MASNFSGVRRLGPDIVDIAWIQEDLVMNTSITYFFGCGSVKYAKNTMWHSFTLS